jgi:3-phenylpropionate/trans-cinnamate dioxygenase ferredoxin subunit
MSDGNWQRVASHSDVKEGEAFPTRLGDVQIALYRIDGKLYALDDVCTHAFALLSQGFVEGDEIECPLHQARFEIATGRCTAAPADRDLRSYEVRVDGEDVYVRAPA